jgi:phosphoribosyl 1,2-cyclic phosphodiesterase
VRTGGNTACVEVEHEGVRLILDGGTGLRALGEAHGLSPLSATVLFTHVHWDHIQGVPYFIPAYHPDSRLTLVGAVRESGSLRDALAAQMAPPRFPVTLDALQAKLTYTDIIRPPEPFEVGPFRITPIDMNHPDGVLAYRIDGGGKSMVFATDVEHAGTLDHRLIDVSTGVDLLVHDAQYTTDEYTGRVGISRRGWGHSTWDEAVQVALLANAERLALFHHDPNRADEQVEEIEAQAQDRFSGTFAAREGSLLTL